MSDARPIAWPPKSPILGDFEGVFAYYWLNDGWISGMAKRIRGTTQNIVAASRHLRLNPTPAEVKLWESLKQRQLNGLKFRRQHPIASFIVDFYCPQYRLMIEVDGDSHHQQTEYDAARTERLNQLGYQVLRFRNEEIFDHLDHVLERIAQATQISQ